ncbi:hypothetical protein BMS3Abin17_01264 [archaeon BMS3Abin17]|nr:hypothetical protein BMS3Abin17_01264 [archaeon BMS3Abin17]HDZ60599.1 hypothetical protein [Candidatus Pacearchaeota archaeon]
MDFQKPEIRGTLNEKLKEVRAINTKIKRYQAKGIRESTTLDNLLDRRHDLEWSIGRNLSSKKRISDPILNYCFNHLVPTDEKYTVFEKVPLVKDFMKHVKSLKGEKILSAQGNSLKTGIISEKCVFGKDRYNYLYVPVKKLYTLNSGKWERGKENLLYISRDIFQYNNRHSMYFDKSVRNNLGDALKKAGMTILTNRKKGHIWETDYSKTTWFGRRPADIKIYLGNNFVDEELKDYSVKIERRIKVPLPKF